MKLLLLLACFQSAPDTSGLPQYSTAKMLEIKATRLPATNLQTPLAISRLLTPDLTRARSAASLYDPLTLLPGVFVLNGDNYAQDLRISVRGFGARAAFGIRGIQLVVDGIPESTPDGQAEVDNIDPAALQNLELLRSPAAGLYGNAAGGVLLLETTLPDSGFHAGFQITGGSFGLQRYLLQAGRKRGAWATQGTLSHQKIEGYREHAGMRSTQATFKSVYRPNERTRLSFLLAGVDSPQADDPGGLTTSQADTDPRQARAQALTFNTGERVRHGRAGVVLQKQHGRVDWGGRLFGTLRRLENRLPFTAAGNVELQRAFGGGGLFAGYRALLAGGEWRAQAGMDIERQSDSRARYDNLQGERGPLVLDQLEVFNKVGVWTVQQWTHRQFSAMASLRADLIRVRALDRFFTDGNQSGNRGFWRLSPMFGIAWQPSATRSWYANLADNFETPTLNELSNNPSGGGFAALRPQRSQNLEIGFKQSATRFLQAEVALFHIRLRDELVPYQLPEFPGRNFFRNAGRSQRNGLEIGLRVFPTPAWSLHTTYTWSDFRYLDYNAGGQSYDRNRLPGIPQHQAQGELRFQHKGTFLALQTRYVGSMYTDDANTEIATDYWLCHLRGSRTIHLRKYQVEPSFGIQNIFNQRFYGNILLNAAGGRYYEPGMALNIWVGVKVGIRN